MLEPIDFCKFFADIEADPKALTPSMTVRQFQMAKEHVNECKRCYDTTERVLAKEIRDNSVFPSRGLN